MVESDSQWHSSSVPYQKAMFVMLPTIKRALNDGIHRWQPAGGWKGIRILNFCFGPILVKQSHDAQKKCLHISIKPISNTFTKRKWSEGHA